MEFTAKLQRAFDERGLNPRKVADHFDGEPSYSTVRRWLSGQAQPSLEEAFRLAAFLGLPLEYLADPALDAPPLPEITEDERAVIDMIRALNLSRAEAMRGLAAEVTGMTRIKREVAEIAPQEAAALFTPGEDARKLEIAGRMLDDLQASLDRPPEERPHAPLVAKIDETPKPGRASKVNARSKDKPTEGGGVPTGSR